MMINVTKGSLIAFALSAVTAVAGETDTFDQQVREALLRNPSIILEVFELLENEQKATATEADVKLIADFGDRLFDGASPEAPVLVEFFDYNCGYCQRGAGEVEKAGADIEGLEVLHMQFPILGESSVALAKTMLGVRIVHGDTAYFDLHDRLMADDGRMKARFNAHLEQNGFDLEQIQVAAQSDVVKGHLAEALQLARALSISGTPAYVTRSRVLRGYVEALPLTAAILAVSE